MKRALFIILAIACIFTLSPASVYGNGSADFCVAELIAGGVGENGYPVGQVIYDWYDYFGLGSIYCNPEEIPLFYSMYATYCMDIIHHDWQSNPSDFPQTKKGNPIPGHFLGNYDLEGCWYGSGISCIAKEDLCSLGEYNAVHMQIRSSDDEIYEESAWAACYDGCDGGNFPGKNWATYFRCNIPVEICNDQTTASIGDFVWLDSNGNGIQDAGEPGVEGVTVDLFASCSGSSLIATTATNANGFYMFTNMNPGDYLIKFSNLPAGYFFTIKNAVGSLPDNDSDANQSTGESDCITLSPGEMNNTIDAGLFQPS